MVCTVLLSCVTACSTCALARSLKRLTASNKSSKSSHIVPRFALQETLISEDNCNIYEELLVLIEAGFYSRTRRAPLKYNVSFGDG